MIYKPMMYSVILNKYAYLYSIIDCRFNKSKKCIDSKEIINLIF